MAVDVNVDDKVYEWCVFVLVGIFFGDIAIIVKCAVFL